MSHVLMIDSYDSFTYNLVQAFRVLGAEVTVRYHDEIDVEEARDVDATHVVLSPGSGRPEEGDTIVEIVRRLAGHVPVLGVCLGHQAIAVAYGGRVGPARALMHGKASQVHHDGHGIFAGLPTPFPAGRYHSLAVPRSGLPDDLTVSARTADGEVMGLRHRRLPVEGIQFHPESVLTPVGDRLLANFLALRVPEREMVVEVAR
ncbi:MAG TPA: aminodeoxychorismate/anthranilate synthase component II [Acidimicrobiia bacterium]|nr:aminodeoxychorismate/anthranilate synthase component II [Acidimicrobiia bacterium]